MVYIIALKYKCKKLKIKHYVSSKGEMKTTQKGPLLTHCRHCSHQLRCIILFLLVAEILFLLL